jgi:hypothetical protein
MSARNGDKSRFHIGRKRRIAQRLRNRELLQRAAPATSASASAPAKTKDRPA